MVTPILITGASGFVGSNLLRRLVKEVSPQKVHVLLRKSSNTWRIGEILRRVRVHTVDLRSEAATKTVIRKIKPRTIFHLAVHGAYPYQQFDEREIVETNVLCAFNLMAGAIETGFDSFVNTGTSSEYGINQKSMREGDSLNPVTAYGISKVWSTLYGKYLSISQKTPLTTLRLFGVYGFYEPRGRLIPNIILSILENKPCLLAHPGFTRDFVFVEDVVDAYLLAAEQYSSGMVLNVGSGKKTTLEEVFLAVRDIMKSKAEPVWDRSITGLPDINRRIADIKLAKKYLSWKPKTNLDDGLQQTVDWFKKNIFLYEHSRTRKNG